MSSLRDTHTNSIGHTKRGSNDWTSLTNKPVKFHKKLPIVEPLEPRMLFSVDFLTAALIVDEIDSAVASPSDGSFPLTATGSAHPAHNPPTVSPPSSPAADSPPQTAHFANGQSDQPLVVAADNQTHTTSQAHAEFNGALPNNPALASEFSTVAHAAAEQQATAELAQDDHGPMPAPADIDQRIEYVFIDPAVEDTDILLAGLIDHANPDIAWRVVWLNAGTDGIDQITTALNGVSGVNAIHLLSHGDGNGIQLGSTLLDLESAAEHIPDIWTWGQSMDTDADLLIYGCDLASTEPGRGLIELIAETSGSDVAASEDTTGHTTQGGDWDLEYQTGDVTTAVAITPAAQQAWQGTLDITSNLVLHYTFDTDATDSSGNSYDGTLQGDAAIDTTTGTNQLGSGKLSLDGVGDYVNLDAHVGSLSGLTEGTIAAWVQTSSTAEDTIFSVSDSGAALILAKLSIEDGNLKWLNYNDVSNNVVVYSTADINDGTWHHIAVTVSNTGNALYIDGAPITANYTIGDASVNAFFSSLTNVDAIALGHTVRSNVVETEFSGLIDDARIYDRALSTTDIAELANYAGPVPQTFTVTNTNDSGAGSLRQAIINANADDVADTIEFDIPGSGTQVIQLTTALDPIIESVSIDGTTQTGWVEGSFLPIVIDGELQSSGLVFGANADNSEVHGLVMRDFTNSAVEILIGSENNLIAGNWFGQFNSDGSDAGDTEALQNLAILGVGDNNVVGGTTAADRNVIVTDFEGIRLFAASSWSISGNYFGTDTTGSALLTNAATANKGVAILNGGVLNTIGGNTAAHQNIFAGLATGIHLQDAGSQGNTLQNNWIGLAADGTTVLENEVGILLTAGISQTVIGGAGLGNVIVGSSSHGIYADDSNQDTVIQGNYIGQNDNGTVIAGNQGSGIYVDGLNGSDVTIGGTSAGEGNVITDSGAAGITLDDATGTGTTGVTIRGNSISGNQGIGIDLGNDGVTANDSDDTDAGPNNLQNSPVLNTVSINDAGDLVFTINTSSFEPGTYTIDLYASSSRDGGPLEGERYLGESGAVPAGSAAYSSTITGVTLTPGDYVTALVTDSNGNTSEFSNYAVATDSDTGGSTPGELQASTTTGGGLSLNHDGGDDAYLIADDGDAILGGLSSATIEVQFSSTQTLGDFPLISYATSANATELLLFVNSNGKLNVNVGSGAAALTPSAFDYLTLADGQVHTVALTWTGTGGVWEVFVDGVLQDSGTGLLDGGSIGAGGALLFGQQQSTVEGGFDPLKVFGGTLYNARVFSEVQTAPEIAATYRSELPFNEPNLVAQWRFNDQSSGGVTTESVSGNNLTLKQSNDSGFTAGEPALTFVLNEQASSGEVVGVVTGVDTEREAQIASLLAADSSLVYSAETGKFYKLIDATSDHATAVTTAAAGSNALNGVNGQLVSIGSATEQEIVHHIALGQWVWISGSDETVENEWRWQNSGTDAEQFSIGGQAINGAYENFQGTEPQGAQSDEDYLVMSFSGSWNDTTPDGPFGFIIEYNADAVLDTTQAITYTITSQTVAGAFAIDADSGLITVADGSLLNYASNATHTLSIRTTDVDGNTNNHTFNVALQDLLETDNAPTNLSPGITLNTGSENASYLITSNGGAVLGGLQSFTIETTASLQAYPGMTEQVLISYASANGTNDLFLGVYNTGNLYLIIDGSNFRSTTNAFPELLDGQPHALGVSWDSTNGDLAYYIDGVLVETATGFAQGLSLDSNGVLVLGQDQDIAASGFEADQALHGTLHDVRIWNVVRSDAEIALNYQHKLNITQAKATTIGLAANWQMDGFSGTENNEVVDVVAGNNLNLKHVDTTPLVWFSNIVGGASVDDSAITFIDEGAPAGYGSQVNSDPFSALGFTDDYTVSFTLDNVTSHNFMIGLGLLDSGADSSDIDHAFYIDETGAVYSSANGTPGVSLGAAVTAGEQFSLYINGTTIAYQRDGVTVHTETIPSGSDWYLDTSFNSVTADDYSLSNLRLFHGNSEVTSFIASEATDALHINENAYNGNSVGFVMASDPDSPNDVISDGQFFESSPPSSGGYVNAGTNFGLWSSSGGSSVLISRGDGSYGEPPSGGGNMVHLNEAGSYITTTFDTEAGKQYQVIFSHGGDWGDGTREIFTTRVSANGEFTDFVLEKPADWNFTSNMQWQDRSFTFTANEATTDLSFISNQTVTSDDAMIANVRVLEIPSALNTILSNDSTLSYDAATDKFYRTATDTASWSVAANTLSPLATVNGVSGQLVTIGSAYENELIRQMALASGANVYIGGNDVTVEGEWRWLNGSEDGDQFGTGSTGATAISGQYANFGPIDGGDGLFIVPTTGEWHDAPDNESRGYVIEWDASEVLSNFTFSVVDPSNNFDINTNTGEITVATAHTLDTDVATSHNIDVTVTDAAGNTYAETLAVNVEKGIRLAQTVPGAQSVDEDAVLTFTGSSAITVTDSLPDGDTMMQVILSVSDGVLFLPQTSGLLFPDSSNGSSSITIQGTESDINSALEGMTFTPNAEFSGTMALDVTTSLSADLVGHYPFDSDASDTSAGLNQDGTLTGNANITLDTTHGQVLSLDGTDDYVQITGLMGEPENITLAAWINANSTDVLGSVVISMGVSPALYLDSDGTLIGFYQSAGTSYIARSTESLPGSGWRHVAVSIDTANQALTIYLDGSAIETIAAPVPISYNYSPDTFIGKAGNSSASYDFDGLIDDVRVYGRALSSAEIQGIVGYQTTTTDTVPITVQAINDAPTFGVGDGIVTTDIASDNDSGQSIAIQTDGKILVAGRAVVGGTDDLTLLRYHSDGTLDTSFDGDGIVTLAFGSSTDRGVSVAVQTDGKILAGGYSINSSGKADFALARYNSDGSPDTSFSGDGKLTTGIGSVNDIAHNINVLADGKILLSGVSYNAGGDADFALVRYNSDGSLDTSFNGDGTLTTAFTTDYEFGNRVMVQTDGKILVGGYSNNGSNDDFAVVRYNSDGTLDTSFSGDGMVTTAIGVGNEYVQSITLQTDGKILVGGHSSENNDFALVRYNSDGSLDTSFSGDGIVTTDIEADWDRAYNVTVQTDGKILLTGSAIVSGNHDFAMVRYNNDGSLDTTLDGDGKLTTDIALGNDKAYGLAIQTDGKILLAGESDNGSSTDFTLVRYNTDGSLDDSFALITTLDGNPVFTEEGAAVALDADVDLSDADLDALNAGNGNYHGASVTVVRSGTANSEDTFSFDDRNGITLSGNSLIKNSQIIATFDTTSIAGQLVVTFTDTNTEIPTSVDVDNILQQIMYANSSQNPVASVQLDWTFNDANSGAQGSGGAQSAFGNTTVTLVNIDEPATLTVPIAQSGTEDTAHIFSSGNGNAIVIASGSLNDPTVSVTLSVNSGTLTLATTTGISFLDGTSDGDTTFTISGSESDLNTAINGLQYTGDLHYHGSDVLTVTTGSSAATEANIYARYNFLSGSTDDDSGNGYHGTPAGNPTLVNDAERGDVMRFDGDDTISVINGTSGLGDQLTMAAWVNLDAGQTDAVFLSIGDEFYITLDRSITSISMSLSANNFSTSDLDPANRIAGQGWNHVAATINDVTKELHLYLNGNLIQDSAFSFADIDWATAKSQNITLGALSDGLDAFVGDLDDVRLYDTELSAAEIAALTGDNGYDSSTVAITLAAVNDTPAVTAPTTNYTVNEQENLAIEGTGFSATDVDNVPGTMTATVSVVEGAVTIVEGDSGVTISSGNGSSTVMITGTLPHIDNLLRGTSTGTITYINNSDSPSATTTITVTVNDGGHTGIDPGLSADGSSEEATASQTINIAAINDDPTNAGSLPSDIDINEDTPGNVDLSAVDFSDFDAQAGNQTVLLSTSTGGQLIAIAGGGITLGGVPEELTLTGLLTDLNSYFNNTSNITYQHPTQHYNGNDADTLLIKINDNGNTGAAGGTDQLIGTVNIDITPVNDAPVLDNGVSVALTAQNEDASAPVGAVGTVITKLVAVGGNVSDIDTSPVTGVAITAADTSNGSWWITIDGGTNWTALGNVSDANARLLNANNNTRIYLQSATDFNGTITDAITFRAWDQSSGTSGSLQDTTTNGGTTPFSAATATAIVTVKPVNDAPILASVEGSALAYNENEGAAAVTSALTTSDVDDSNVESATVVITSNYTPAEDSLTFANTANITGNWNAATGELTLTGTDRLAAYQAAIRSVTYENISDNPNTLSRTLSFTTNDGEFDSVAVTRNIDISNANDTPVQTGIENTSLLYDENDGAVITTTSLSISDIDGDNLTSATVSISGNYSAGEDVLSFNGTANISSSFDAATGVLLLTGSATTADYEAALRSVTYENTSDDPLTTSRTLSFVVSDGLADASAVTRSIAITATNDNPQMVLNGIVSFIENSDPELLAPSATISDVDSDDFDGGVLTIALTSNQHGLDRLAIQSVGTGSNQVSTSGADVSVSGTTVGSFSGGDHGSTPLVITFNANADRAAVEAVLRSISFQHLSDNPVSVRSFQATLTDGDGGSVGQSENIAVIGVNDAPGLSGISGDILFAVNDGTVHLLDTNVPAALTDPDYASDYNGGAITLTGNSFDADETLGISTTGSVSLSNGFIDGSVVSVGGTPIGSLSGVSNNTVTVTLNPNATSAGIDELIGSFSYSSTSLTLGPRGVDVFFNDNDGTTNGGQQSTTSSMIIFLGESGAQTVSGSEDLTYVFGATDFTGSGISASSIDSITVTTLPTAGNLQLNGSALALNTIVTRAQLDAGLLTFVPIADQNGLPYTSVGYIINGGNSTVSFLAGETTPFTLDGASWPDATAIANNTLNFGPDGVVSNTISVIATSNTIDAAYLAQGTVLLNGYVADSALTGPELAAINTWVTNGGVLIATGDHSDFDPVNAYFGLNTIDNGNTTWRIADTDNPIINGPFGLVGNVADTFSANGTSGYFAPTSLAAGDLIIAEDAVNGNPTMVLRALGDGYMLFTTDEGIFRQNMTGGGSVVSANDKLTANVFAWASSLSMPTEFNNLTINVAPVNDAPTQSGIEAAALTYTENNGAVSITSSIELYDIDDSNLESATVAITGNYINGEDILALTNTANISASWDAANGVLTLTGSDTKGAYQAALRSITYENTSDDLDASSRTVSFSINDGEFSALAATRTIDLVVVNDVPTQSSIEPAALSYTENAGAVAITSSLTVSDVDDDFLESATIAISANYTSGEDLLAFTDTANISGNWNASTGELSLAGTDTKAAYQAALRSVTYENTSENPLTMGRTVAFTVNDGDGDSAVADRIVDIIRTNDAPVQSSIEGTALEYTENDGAVITTDNIVVSDIDDTDLESASIAITNNYAIGEDVLSFINTASITSTFNSTTGTLTLTGNDTVAAYQSALRSVTFNNTSDDPSALSRTLTYSINDGDVDSAVVTRTVDLTPVNDAPESSLIEPTTPPAYAENGAAVTIAAALDLYDVDDVNLESALVSITENFVNTEDVLLFNNTATITGSWNPITGLLSLSGSDTVAGYQAALRSITYENTSDDPSTLSRTVTIIVNDGSLDSAAVLSTIDIIPLNDAPVLSGIEPTTLSYTENDGAVLTTATISVDDIDDTTLDSASVAITGNYVTGEDVLALTSTATIASHFNALTGVLTLTGNDTVAAYQSALRSVTYENTSDDPKALIRTLSFAIDDGVASSAVVSRTIDVTVVNDAPVQSTIETTAVNYTENDSAMLTTATLSLSDVDDINLESATVSITANYISGEDLLSFSDTANISSSFNPLTGILSLTGTDSVSAYEAALRSVTYHNSSDNPSAASRLLTFVINDGDLNATAIIRPIEVTPVNDAPVQSAIESSPLTYTENDGPAAITPGLILSDVDDTNLESAVVTITGNYAAWEDVLVFNDTTNLTGSFDTLTGTLTITGTESIAAYEAALRSVTYENTNDNPLAIERTVAFVFNDGDADAQIVTRNIDVLAVNDATVPGTIESTAIRYIENDLPVPVTSTLSLTDFDDTTLETATVAIAANYTAGEDVLGFTNTTTISGSFDVLTGILTLTGSDTLSAYESALRSVTYHNTSDNPSVSPRVLSIHVNDGDTDSAVVTRLLTLVAVNDRPIASSIETTALVYNENDSAVPITTTLAIDDLDDQRIESAVVTITDNFASGDDLLGFINTPNISANWDAITGTLTLTGTDTVAAYEAALRTVTYQNISDDLSALTRTVAFKVNDGDTDSETLSRSITVNAINDAPVLSAIESTALAYTENQGASAISAALTLADLDDTHLESARVQITGNYRIDEDRLSFSNTALITGSWDPLSGTLTLIGSATKADYQAALYTVSFSNDNDDPSTLNRNLSITVNDGNVDSNTLNRSVALAAVNDAPTQTNIETAPLVYWENSGAVGITSSVSFNDEDNVTMTSLTVTFSDGYAPAEDRLAFTDTPTITGGWDLLHGQLILTGTDTLAAYQDAVRQITYENISDEPVTANRTLSITASDGLLNTNTLTRGIVLLSVNDAPTGTDKTISINEDIPYTVTPADFGFNDLIDADQLAAVRISSLPLAGLLTVDGNITSAGSVISLAQLNAGALVYTPALNDNGLSYAMFEFKVRDDGGTLHSGIDQDSIPNTLTFNVAPVSDAPFGTDTRVNQLEDTTYLLTVNDFGFQDPADNDTFTSVIIDQLPLTGSLTLNAEAVAAGQVILSSDIVAGLLSFTPDLNENGNDYAALRFRAQDSGTDGGLATATVTNTMIMDIISVNDAPFGSSTTVQTLEDTPYELNQNDFGFTDSDDDDLNTFAALTIVSLPETGTLTFDGIDAFEGLRIPVSSLDAGLLVYTPPANESGTGYNGFGFQVQDNGGRANGGIDTSSTVHSISFDLPGVNDSPLLITDTGIVDEGAEFTITSAVLFGSDADDPDPRELTMTITSLPAHGELRINGRPAAIADQFTLADIQALVLSYQHDESETSEDRFGVSLADGGEDQSQPARGDFEIAINEVIDAAPILDNDILALNFGQAFDSLEGDLLDSGFSGLSGNSLIENTLFQVEIEDAPSHGKVTLNTDGTFTYVHDGSTSLNDTFSYRVTNEDGVSAVATVSITVEPPIGSAFSAAVPAPKVAEVEPETQANPEPTEAEASEDNLDAATNDIQGEPALANAVAVGGEDSATVFIDAISIANANSGEIRDSDDGAIPVEQIATKQYSGVSIFSLSTEGYQVVSSATLNLVFEVDTTSVREVISNHKFLDGLAQLDNNFQSIGSKEQTRYRFAEDTVFGVSFSATIGALAWALRGGALFASFMTATPVWATLDIARIAKPDKDSKKKSEHSDSDSEANVEEIFDN